MQEWLDTIPNSPEPLKFLVLAAMTLVSEDLTCISTGTLIAEDLLNPITGILACFVGIFVGDGMLYVVGLLMGKRALQLPILRSLLSEQRVERCRGWFEANGFKAVLISRFIPGTRLPTYFAAGLMGSRAKFFLFAAAIATAIWTPLIVIGAWFFGAQMKSWLQFSKSKTGLAFIIIVISSFIMFRLLLTLGDWKKRRRLKSRLYRFVRWEFWPIIVLYTPVFLYNIWLALKYRRLNLFLGSNPGIEFSGMVGESKHQIMSKFNHLEEFVAHFGEIPAMEDLPQRLDALEAWMAQNGESYPVILKPDVGQRGSGVKRVENRDEAATYLQTNPNQVQIQAFAPGPYEFGVYYRRFPNQPTGEILGLTGKEFPQVVGNGRDDLEHLILKNPGAMGRYHIFRERFKNRLASVPAPGEVIHLVNTGNHCLGTIFNDSSHLLTPALQERFDDITKHTQGIYIGRYDIRATNLEDFRLGRAFKILEFNGATCEPSHMYDLRYGLLFGLKSLFKHYASLWEIGSQNAKSGVRIPKLSALIKAFFKARQQAKSHPKPE